MYKNKLLSLFNNYILNKLHLIIFFGLTLTFIINSFLNIGLFTDGSFTFINLLQDLTWDNENRHFETFISHFATIILLFLGIKNINFLIIVHGFCIYFSTLILLFISYLLYPTKQKHLFFLTSISYLIIINICSGFITSQSFIGAGLYWIIITPLIFENFDSIPYKKVLIMIIASFFMIKGYQLDIIFMIIFIIWSLNLLKKIKKTTNKNLILIFLLVNISALSYNLYQYIFKLIYRICISLPTPLQQNLYQYYDCYYLKKLYVIDEILCSNYLFPLIILLILISIILYSIIKNENSKENNLITISLIFVVFVYMLKINFIYSLADFRVLNYFLPLLLSFLIYFVFKKNLTINIKFLKLLNLVLLITFIVNICSISIQWNKQINAMYSSLIKKEGITEIGNKNIYVFEHLGLHRFLSILIQKQHGISNIKTVFKPTIDTFFICKTFPDLSKYGIYYSKELQAIKEQEELKQKKLNNI